MGPYDDELMTSLTKNFCISLCLYVVACSLDIPQREEFTSVIWSLLHRVLWKWLEHKSVQLLPTRWYCLNLESKTIIIIMIKRGSAEIFFISCVGAVTPEKGEWTGNVM